MSYFVYLMANKNNSVLYLGRTENLAKRIYEHKNKLIKGFTQKYNIDKLVYFEVHQDKEEAATREWKIKKWKRAWKDELINEMNPSWEDLYDKL